MDAVKQRNKEVYEGTVNMLLKYKNLEYNRDSRISLFGRDKEEIMESFRKEQLKIIKRDYENKEHLIALLGEALVVKFFILEHGSLDSAMAYYMEQEEQSSTSHT